MNAMGERLSRRGATLCGVPSFIVLARVLGWLGQRAGAQAAYRRRYKANAPRWLHSRRVHPSEDGMPRSVRQRLQTSLRALVQKLTFPQRAMK